VEFPAVDNVDTSGALGSMTEVPHTTNVTDITKVIDRTHTMTPLTPRASVESGRADPDGITIKVTTWSRWSIPSPGISRARFTLLDNGSTLPAQASRRSEKHLGIG
jgi:hypothetical protein